MPLPDAFPPMQTAAAWLAVNRAAALASFGSRRSPSRSGRLLGRALTSFGLTLDSTGFMTVEVLFFFR